MKHILAKQIAKATSIVALATTITITSLVATAPPAQAGISFGLCVTLCVLGGDDGIDCALICRNFH